MENFIFNKKIDLFIITLPMLLLLFLSGIAAFVRDADVLDALFLIITFFDLSHLSIVFLRSHGNQVVFNQFRRRFLISPLIIIPLFIIDNEYRFYIAGFVALWDLWHVSMQNFGIARIYQGLNGKSVSDFRMSDMLIHLFTFGVPALVLSRFFFTLELEESAGLYDLFVRDKLWGEIVYNDRILWGSLQAKVFLACYALAIILSLIQFLSNQHRSKLRISFNIATITSLYVSFLYLGIIYTITLAALMHGIQYYVIVWSKEKANVTKVFFKKHALIKFLGINFLICFLLFNSIDFFEDFAIACILTIRILHFWYDGFIWSVRRGNV